MSVWLPVMLFERRLGTLRTSCRTQRRLCTAGKPSAEGGRPAAAAGALPPRPQEGRKRPGLGFETGPPHKRARGGGDAEGDKQSAPGRAEPNAAHSNGIASDGASRQQPGDSLSAPDATGRHSQQDATHKPIPAGTAPGSPTSREGERAERPVYTDQCTAFVKNIAPKTTDDELREVFAECGQLQALRHLRQANGDSRVMSWILPL